MSLAIHFYISLISSGFSIIPLFFGLIFHAYKKNSALLYVVLVSAMFEILGIIFSKYQITTFYLSQLFTVLEFVTLFHFYSTNFKNHINVKRLYFIIPVYATISIIDFFHENYESLGSYALIIESVFFIIISLLSFLYLIIKQINVQIINSSFFWVNSAVLIYFSGNILLFLFYKSIKPNDFFTLYVFLHSSLNIIYNSLLCISFYKSKQL